MDVSTIAAILGDIGTKQVKIVSVDKITCCCPLAFWTHTKGRDNNPSMVVRPEGPNERPVYVCLSCHKKGSLRDMLLFLVTKGFFDCLKWVEVLDGETSADQVKPTKAKKLIGNFRKVSRPGTDSISHDFLVGTNRRKKTNKPFYDYQAIVEEENKIEEIPWEVYEAYAGSVPRYAIDRGLTVDTCREWELGHDKRMKRLLFPIRDRKGRLVAISGRIYVDDCPACGAPWIKPCEGCGLSEDEHVDREGKRFCASGEKYVPTRACCSRCGAKKMPKYLHSKGFPRRVILYGEHRKEKASDGRVYVVEGHIDMLKMWQFGYRPIVALLGSHPSPLQIEKIVREWQKVVVVPDGNQAGRDMGVRVKKMIAGRIEVTIKTIGEGRDPGDMTEEEFRDLPLTLPDFV